MRAGATNTIATSWTISFLRMAFSVCGKQVVGLSETKSLQTPRGGCVCGSHWIFVLPLPLTLAIVTMGSQSNFSGLNIFILTMEIIYTLQGSWRI